MNKDKSRYTICFTMKEKILLMQLAARKGMNVNDFLKNLLIPHFASQERINIKSNEIVKEEEQFQDLVDSSVV